jgi:hypothetical protein
VIFSEEAASAAPTPLYRNGLTPILTIERCASLASAGRDWSEG